MSQSCAHCESIFTPRVQVKNQRYCEKIICQKARKQKWQQEHLKFDADYRENQKAAQASWCEQHRDYWRKYREQHPAYTGRNRQLQRERNRKRRAAARIAKMDACHLEKDLKNKPFGLYQLIPFSKVAGIAKMDAWVVEIRAITSAFGQPVVVEGMAP